jgi:hypothetical protein
MEEMKMSRMFTNEDAVLAGRFKIVARKKNEFGEGNERVVFYNVALSSGEKIIEITAGEKSPVVNADMYKDFDMEFSYEKNEKGFYKLKVVEVSGLTTQKPVGTSAHPGI